MVKKMKKYLHDRDAKYYIENMSSTWMIAPGTIGPEDNCPRGKFPSTIKFPSKIIARTQVNFPKRAPRVKLCMGYEYYN